MDTAIFLICSNSFEVAMKFATLDRNININRELIGYYGNLYQLPIASTFTELVGMVVDNLFLKDIPSEVRILLYSKKWKLWEALEQAAIVDDLEFVKHFRNYYKTESAFVTTILGLLYIIPDNTVSEYLFAEKGFCDATHVDDYQDIKTFLKYGFIDLAKKCFEQSEDEDARSLCAEELAANEIWEPLTDLEEVFQVDVLKGVLRTGKVDVLKSKYSREEIPKIFESFALYIGSAEMVDYLEEYIDIATIEQDIAESETVCSYQAMKRIVVLKGEIVVENDCFASICSLEDDLKLCELFEISQEEILESSLYEAEICLKSLKILIEKDLLTTKLFSIAKCSAEEYPDLELREFIEKHQNFEFLEEDLSEIESD